MLHSIESQPKKKQKGKMMHKPTWFFVLLVLLDVGSASSQNTRCPFDFLFHFGDGVFDTGNAIRTLPFGPGLPPAHLPYGMSFPGIPTGRWSDGLLDIDNRATAMGFSNLVPYLRGNASLNNGIIFAVARSPVLDRSFFTFRSIKIPPYAAPLSIQLSWFRSYINSICKTPADCADNVGNSLFVFGDVEANDVALPLIQGKSIRVVSTYMSFVTQAQINAAREVIRMGATRVILSGNVPIGCYPYILTELSSSDPGAYDKFGCLKKVNDLVVLKNKDLQKAVNNLSKQYRNNVTIIYADFYSAFQTLLKDTSSGSYKNLMLKACCGIGGKYNYNSKMFCGATEGVSFCSDPSKYIHWDGIHLTQTANNRLSSILQGTLTKALKCGSGTSKLFSTM